MKNKTLYRAEVAERALIICVRSYMELLTKNQIFDNLNATELRVYKKFITQAEKDIAKKDIKRKKNDLRKKLRKSGTI